MAATPTPTSTTIPVATPAAPIAPAVPIMDVSFIANPTASRLERLGDQVHRYLSGGHVTADSPYGRREIMLALEEVRVKRQGEINLYNADRKIKFQQEDIEFRRKQFFEDYEFIYKLGGDNEQWMRHYDLPAFFDDDRGLFYWLLPQQFVSIQRYQNLPNEQFIQRIERVKYAANKNFAPRFIPVNDGMVSLFSGVYRGGMQGNVPVGRIEDRAYAYFDDLCDMPLKVGDKYRFFFIMRSLRDGLSGPGYMTDVSDADMVMGAVAMLMRKTPEDKVNDNNATAA